MNDKKIGNATLPWERITRDGYAALDLKCVVFDAKTMLVKRLTPGEPNGGNFVVMIDGERITENTYASRADAIAEAERFVYDQPQFAASSSATAVKTAVAMGGQAFAQGVSIYANPYTQAENAVSRSQWVQGWLEAFARSQNAKLMQAAEATARANLQLESDLSFMIAQARVFRLAINFAANLAKQHKPKVGLDFLIEWSTSNDEQGFHAKYPEWKAYRDADQNSPADEPKPSTTN